MGSEDSSKKPRKKVLKGNKKHHSRQEAPPGLPPPIPPKRLREDSIDGILQTYTDEVVTEDTDPGALVLNEDSRRLLHMLQNRNYSRRTIDNAARRLTDLQLISPSSEAYSLLERVIDMNTRLAEQSTMGLESTDCLMAIEACKRLESSKETGNTETLPTHIERKRRERFVDLIYSIWSEWDDAHHPGMDMNSTAAPFAKLMNSPAEILLLFKHICDLRSSNRTHRSYRTLGPVAESLSDVKYKPGAPDKRMYRLASKLAAKDSRNIHREMYRKVLELPPNIPDNVFAVMEKSVENYPEKSDVAALFGILKETTTRLEDLFTRHEPKIVRGSLEMLAFPKLQEQDVSGEDFSDLSYLNRTIKQLAQSLSEREESVSYYDDLESTTGIERIIDGVLEPLPLHWAHSAEVLLRESPEMYNRLEQKKTNLLRSNAPEDVIRDYIGIYSKWLRRKRLTSVEQEKLNKLLYLERKIATDRNRDRRSLDKILDKGAVSVPSNLVRPIKKKFSVTPARMWDFVTDSMHWYDEKQAVKTLLSLYDVYSDPDMERRIYDTLVAEFVLSYYHDGAVVRQDPEVDVSHSRLRNAAVGFLPEEGEPKPPLAAVYFGCGDARKELYIHKRLQHFFDVSIHLVDKSEAMLQEACRNCEEQQLSPEVYPLDFVKEFSPEIFSDIGRPILAVFMGDTLLNLHEIWDVYNKERTMLANLAPEHRAKSAIVAEGHTTKNQQFYRDYRNREFFTYYLGSRLGIPRQSILDKEGRPTYLVEDSEDENRINVYYVITQNPSDSWEGMLAEDDTGCRGRFNKGDVIKVGFSGRLDIDTFNTKLRSMGLESTFLNKGNTTLVMSVFDPKVSDSLWLRLFRRKK